MATAGQILAKTAATHTVTYFVTGVAAYTLFDYPSLLAQTELGATFRSLRDPMVIAAPALQPIRGLLFGVVFYVLRQPLFAAPRGWLSMWLILVSVGILGPFGAPPGSIEGVLYTDLPLSLHMITMPELLVQSFALSAILYWWVNHPEARWVNWTMGAAMALIILFPIVALTAIR